MASGHAGKVKLLFLMSRDFGELTNAVYFTLGQDLDSVFLVPPSLYRVNQGGLPAPTYPYESVQDILAAVERETPSIVFLFSGYLYANNDLFPIEDLEKLLQALRARGCRIVTSDPFLGVLAGVDEHTFHVDPAVRKRFVEDFARVFALLQPFPHFYHVDLRGLAATEVISCSNPHILRPPAYMPCPPAVYQALGLDPARPRWVFVLATQDYWVHNNLEGTAFDDLLTDQLYETLYQGRQPVLIAPEACTSAVALRSSPADGLVLLPFCRHDRFLSLILEAEYAFYWNSFSNSLLLRTMNRLPVFFFDHGHMARVSTQLFHRGLHCYYVGGCPPCLPMNEPVEAGQLARRAAEQEPAMNAFGDNLRQAPTPVEVVRQLLQR